MDARKIRRTLLIITVLPVPAVCAVILAVTALGFPLLAIQLFSQGVETPIYLEWLIGPVVVIFLGLLGFWGVIRGLREIFDGKTMWLLIAGLCVYAFIMPMLHSIDPFIPIRTGSGYFYHYATVYFVYAPLVVSLYWVVKTAKHLLTPARS